MSLIEKKQVVPLSLQGEEISAADLVISRKAAKCYPVSGSVYKSDSNNTITFRVSSNDFADFSALSLFFKLRVEDRHMLLDDLHSSILERIVVSLNDTVIEDISHVNDLHKVLTYAHVNRSYYQNEMHGCQGAYKYTPGFHGKTGTNNDVYTSENDFVMRIDATSPGSDSINPYYDGRTAITNDYICVSLSTLLGLGLGYTEIGRPP